MVGKKSGKAMMREEGKKPTISRKRKHLKSFPGLERTDNNLDLTTWPQVNMINQKNYYT